jgi:hypothetical protein
MNKLFVIVCVLALALVAGASAVDFYSDTTTQWDNSGWVNAVATWVHPVWTLDITSPAIWIWNAEYVSDDSAVNGEYVKFQKTFELGENCIAETFDGSMDIAADNTFSIKLNDQLVGQDFTEFNYQAKQTFDLTPYLQSGVNTLVIESTNLPLNGGTPTSNPAGIIFKGSATCRENEVPEFGVVLGGVALVGAFGAFLIMRKK